MCVPYVLCFDIEKASLGWQGFTSPFWMTFNQALEFDAHVRKGTKGSLIVYANRITRTEKTDDGDEIEREIPVPERLHGLQRRTNRGSARDVLLPAAADLEPGRADCPGGGVLRQYRLDHPIRW